MARPQKKGIDYFTVDTHMEDKIKLVEAKYGLEGFGLLIKLWQKIYSQKYYIEWDEEIQLLFSSEVNVDINVVNDVINDCVKWGIFNQELFEKYNILTSHGIQIRYKEATYRRKKVEMKEEYLLLNGDEINANMVNENNKPINVDKNSVNDSKSTQSKVKESKVKESKVNQINEEVFFEENFSEFEPFVEDMNKRTVMKAIKISADKNNPLNYAKAVLNDWKKKAKEEIKNKDDPACDYKWKDFFIDFEKFKE
jgi:hypothetical protein